MATQQRDDITGLRAVAILPVLLFHARVAGFSGGFVGVDVFFVISGFLITGLLEHQAAAGAFRYRDFYERRMRRILPALFAVVAACTPVSLILLSPRNLEHAGLGMMATSTFLSNVLFGQETHYFDAAATTKPLLHTWSLSIEEQFYLVFPLIVVGLRRRPRARIAVIALIAAASLGSSINHLDLRGSFFSTPFRFWELALGALLALMPFAWPRRWMADAESLIGIGLIAWAVFAFNERTPFPGANALVPCLGAAAILHAGIGRASLVGRLLSLPPFVGIGLISYSLYVWHWPVLVFYRFVALGDPGPLATAVLLTLIFAVSIVSWRWIEAPFRRPGVVRGRTIFILAGVGSALILAVGTLFSSTHGLPGRFAESYIRQTPRYGEHTCFLQLGDKRGSWSAARCTDQAGGSKSVFLWGDSYAAHYASGLKTLERPLGFNLTQATYATCPPLLDFRSPLAPDCPAFNRQVLAAVAASRPALVVLSAQWGGAESDVFGADPARLAVLVRTTVQALRAAGAGQVLIVGQSPTFTLDVPQLSIGLSASRRPLAFQPQFPMVLDPALRAVAAQQNAAWFAPSAVLCSAGQCRLADAQGHLIYWDNGHYSSAGSAYLARAMRPTLAAVLR
jgi:peptidoglycan/LPS O-acetylase OafA/YrhL